MGLALLIGLMGTSIVILTRLTPLIQAMTNHLESKKQSEEFTLKMNYSVKDSRDLMDYLVSQALMEWQIYNINPSTENYMAEKEIDEAMKYIIKKVMMEMTEISRLRLSVGYPMETEEQQIESIKNKAKLVVLNYAVNQNSDNEEDRIPIKNINAF